MQNRRILILTILLFLFIGTATSPLLGQGDTIITITAPGWVSRAFTDNPFAPFEEQHPGVKVVPVDPADSYYYPQAGSGIEDHLNGVQKYATVADVIYVDYRSASVEASRAGYLLNLAPLVDGDASFNSDDFYPKIWQSAQWDGGVWYIPSSAYVSMLVYDATAFDKAGLAYPNEKWTFDDFANAVRKLTVTDKDGKVIVPGFSLYSPALFYYGLTGHSFFDASVNPSVPKFDDPDLVTFIEQWKALEKNASTKDKYDYEKVVFDFGTPWRLSNRGGDGEQKWAASLLPGGVTSLSIEGFAVSSGTANPDLAYALANFVSTSPEIIDAFGGDAPARRSMMASRGKPAKEVQEIEEVLDKAVPTSELHFDDYLEAAMDKITDDGSFDARSAVQEADANAVKGLEAASARRGSTTVYVVTPVPTPAMSANQIVLRFAAGVDVASHQDAWNGFIHDYLAANPAVGNVDLVTDYFEQQKLDKLDCYYQPYNVVPSMHVEDYLSFDPYMDADPNFDRNDFIGTVLSQMQRDNHTMGYPIAIAPSVLWYNDQLFAKAGLPSPEQGWTVDQFKDALQSIHGLLDKESDPIFVPGTVGNTYLLMLMAAYGGVPYDYRTTPPTLNFTDPTNVDAIRQVLDLAKAGYIGYQALVGRGAFNVGTESPITDDVLTTDSWRLQNRSNPDGKGASRLVNYPHGSQYTPVAYVVGGAYILSHAQNPDACYSLISQLAKRPDLLNAMPARLSQINDPTITASQGEDVTALY
ncbi:MAG: extracellular solute-binding protein, partial [Chloroflexota bacterium]